MTANALWLTLNVAMAALYTVRSYNRGASLGDLVALIASVVLGMFYFALVMA
jgi:hypothetical protein